jgi:hypothetical protein
LDLVEELGRSKPRMVSELMEIANRFTDGEDAYHSKRARSPEYDRSSRQHNQRHRSRNEDGRTMRNQVAAGYKRREGDEQENDEYHKKANSRWDRSKYFDPSAEDILYGPSLPHPLCISRWKKGFQSSDKRLQNVFKTARSHGTKPRRKARVHDI